jgi:hypothetical protein
MTEHNVTYYLAGVLIPPKSHPNDHMAPKVQAELDEALARMADPLVRAHFERRLKELGYRP